MEVRRECPPSGPGKASVLMHAGGGVLYLPLQKLPLSQAT